MEGVAVKLKTASPLRMPPRCIHFGQCGGCRWQHLPYDKQLFYKEKQVRDNLTRIGHTPIPGVNPIIGSGKQFNYRNKLEFTFSTRAWLTRDEITGDKVVERRPALGFHIPGIYDKILDISECHLMDEPVNAIRNEVRRFALNNGYAFYDHKEHTGFLRNITVRITTTGEIMVLLSVSGDDTEKTGMLLDHIIKEFPQVTSVWYVVNNKRNDSISDLNPEHYYGSETITEVMGGLRFRIGPNSFYQTNSLQAERLYEVVRRLAALEGTENVYDLYTGTGTIACYLAPYAGKVTGIEYVAGAVADANVNAAVNGLENTRFIAGDMKDIFGRELFAENGKADVIVTDPPRAGMHQDVTVAIRDSGAARVVYVSCNPATQARDLDILSEKYVVTEVQPVDMFPQTFHVENVVLLEKKRD